MHIGTALKYPYEISFFVMVYKLIRYPIENYLQKEETTKKPKNMCSWAKYLNGYKLKIS